MGYISEKMDLAVNRTRMLWSFALVLGAGVIGWAMLILPWDESRIGLHVVISSVLFYILPGLIFLVFAWRMNRHNLWAYIATEILCFCFVIKLLFAIVMARGGHLQFYESPIICEVLLRPPAVYLLVACLNAMDDVRDESRRRRRNYGAKGFEPIMTSASALRVPPRPRHLGDLHDGRK